MYLTTYLSSMPTLLTRNGGSNVNNEDSMIINSNILLRNIHDSYFLINITQNYLDDKCYLFELNDAGCYIWNQLKMNISIEKIAEFFYSDVQNEVSMDSIICDIKILCLC